ncbi:L-2-hydroxyglutarate oxidase [Thermocrinis sp.]
MHIVKTDFLVIGSGIMGLTTAWALRESFPDKEICIIDKEPSVGYHASGRNSGVLHAGFYYSPDSLKAKFTKEGNRRLKEFCEERGIKVNKCGKVVVAKNEEELETLYELKRRGDINGVELYLITEKELKDIEPNAKTYKHAIFSPNTATVEPLEVLKALERELKNKEVKFFYSTPYKRKLSDDLGVVAGSFIFKAQKIINCAGLYADKIAKDFGFSKDHVLVPFKGVYSEYTGRDQFINRNIYPVPDIRFPFLGVHFTVRADKKIKIGPTAIPAFWRENYNGVEGLKFEELLEVLLWNAKMFIKREEFRRLAFEEMKKYSKSYLVDQAKMLVHNMPSAKHFKWSKPGIRPQLINKRTLALIQDFVVEGDDYSVHILNAVSPAFTASFPFSEYVVEKYIKEVEYGKVQKT